MLLLKSSSDHDHPEEAPLVWCCGGGLARVRAVTKTTLWELAWESLKNTLPENRFPISKDLAQDFYNT